MQSIQTTIQAQTATAAFLANANEATLQAVTATAAWLGRDDDGDGLPNQREIELGTSPTDPDTDDDGLSDADEINRTLDPLRPDTDGDGLGDGDEIRQGLDPRNPDTDGDGISDSQDPAPLQTSTPAPDIQATQQAALTQTAAAQQGAANSTATSVAATATAQGAANAAATAQAATSTAQAAANATASAQVPTATPETPSPTPPSQPRLAYIYVIDTTVAHAYQTLLQDNGYTVDLVPQDAIPSTDFELYQAAILGPDTGSEGDWGDPDGNQANVLNQTGLPILGLEEGGASFFGRFDLPLSGESGINGEGTSILVVDPADSLWSTPNAISIPGDQILPLYNNNSDFVAINGESPPPELTLFARHPDEAAQFLIAGYQERFLFWGFEDGPDDMTDAGRLLFENLVDRLLP
jgi:hypothetical protein